MGGDIRKKVCVTALFSRRVAMLIIAVVCCSCSARPLQGVLVPATEIADGTSRVAMLVATTRQKSSGDPGEMFNADRAADVSYAAISVSIPPDGARTVGQVQWPASLPGDPTRNFMTVSADYLDRKSFDAQLTAMTKSSARRKVLVFVHGYNNRFDEAVYRLAQIVHDSRVPAVPILFSWPSKGLIQLSAYQDDVDNADASANALQQLLVTISLNSNVQEITLLCHSMGCRPMVDALRAGIRGGNVAAKVKNALLVAADVDLETFRSTLQKMKRPRPRIALFVSQDDQALKISKSIWGGKARLGDVNPDQEPYRSDFEREGILVFDLSNLSGDAHSRAFENVTSIMGMIEQRLASGQQMADSD
jgi:esterase/lipase superfamily enzyme